MNQRHLIPCLGLCFALLPLFACAQAEPTPLGRLFMAPERRQVLERQRQFNLQEIRALEGATLRLDGVVRRSSGKSTVWINGRPQSDGEAAQSGIGVRFGDDKPGSAMIAPGDEAPTQLKVGEAVNRATGERNTQLGGGTLRVPAGSGR